MKADERSNIDPQLTVEEYFAQARRMWHIVGEENFKTLIHDFYLGVADDEVMRPMYPENLGPAEERLYLFIIQYFGGPTTYSEERGHPALRVRHAKFKLDEDARIRWMKHMNAALEKNPMNPDAKDFLKGYFEHTAEFLKNA